LPDAAAIVAFVSQTSAAVLGSARADPAPRSGLYGSSAERSGTSGAFSEDRFLTRARALFYARLAFLVLGLGVIGVPSWSQAFGVGGPRAYAVYLVMVAYSAANYVFLPKKRVGRILTFATLCADLCVLVWLVSVTGGLRSPLLAAQLLFTTLFVVLFPTPLAVVPPLLTFPVVAKLDQMLGGHAVVQIDIFILLWYSAINCILVYVMVYLNERDRMKHRELNKLSKTVREMAIVEERNRLAREIHDGLGGVLSSVAIQSEYLLNMIDGSEVRSRLQGTNEARAAILPTIRKELSDLHSAAEDSMDELRRSLRMMMEDFDLVATLGDYCKLASGRHRLEVRFSRVGRERQVGPESALALFRVLQESITNTSKHCGKGTAVDVTLTFTPGHAQLQVKDHGKGFALPADATAPGRDGHYGLANMRERANKVAGQIRMTSEPGKGTCIELTVHAGEELGR
jgi:signal transduction histidine kinase